MATGIRMTAADRRVPIIKAAMHKFGEAGFAAVEERTQLVLKSFRRAVASTLLEES